MSSAWDGWEKQCFDEMNNDSGEECALGYLYRVYGDFDSAVEANRLYRDKVITRMSRILLDRFPELNDGIRRTTIAEKLHIIIQANDNLRLPPEIFRSLDEEAQRLEREGEEVNASERDRDSREQRDTSDSLALVEA